MALTLKQLIANDIDSVFFNVNEFAEMHTVDGREVMAIIDEAELIARQASMEEGIADSSMLIMLKRKDFAYDKLPKDRIEFDGRMCIVDKWSEDTGVITVLLHQVRSAAKGAFDI